LQVQCERFVAVCTQIVPFLLSKLGASLSWVLRGYSMSFVALNLAFFAFFAHFYRDRRWAMAMLLYTILMCTHVFYWVQAELHQGVPFVLWLGILLQKTKKWTVPLGLLTACILITAIYSHPLTVFLLLFLFGYEWLSLSGNEAAALRFEENKIEKKSFRSWFQALPIQKQSIIVVGLAFVAIVLIKKYVLPIPYYDEDAMASGVAGLKTNLKRFYRLNTFRLFFSINSLKDYAVFWLAVTSVVVFYTKNRKWLALSWLTTFFVGYFLLVVCTFPSNIEQFYMEHMLMPLSAFIILPLSFEIIPLYNSKKYFLAILSLLFALRITMIVLAKPIYTHRIERMDAIMSATARLPNRKLIMNEGMERKHFLMTWGTGYQSLLQSAEYSPDSCRQVMISGANTQYLQWAKRQNNKVLMEFDTLRYRKLPRQYFNIQDTTRYVEYEMR
jgi:hypothetical protein